MAPNPATAQAPSRGAPMPLQRLQPRRAHEPMRFGAFPISETADFPPPRLAQCWVYVTLNAEVALTLDRDASLQWLLGTARTRISVDGQWIWWALRRRYPERPLAKLSGSDLIYTLAAHCAGQGQRLLLLGASEASNAGAVARLGQQWPGLQVAGCALPAFTPGQGDERAALARARQALADWRPDYVVLGLGPTKQYRFAALLAPELDGRVSGVLCFGGAIDMASGQVRRAPLRWQQLGLEGLYRVLQQPSRLWRLLRVMRILPLLATGRY